MSWGTWQNCPSSAKWASSIDRQFQMSVVIGGQERMVWDTTGNCRWAVNIELREMERWKRKCPTISYSFNLDIQNDFNIHAHPLMNQSTLADCQLLAPSGCFKKTGFHLRLATNWANMTRACMHFLKDSASCRERSFSISLLPLLYIQLSLGLGSFGIPVMG